MFSTQCLLYALNLGAKRTLAASATINWMIKDGMGRLARMTVATSFAQNFDSEIKVRATILDVSLIALAGVPAIIWLNIFLDV